MQSEFWLVSVLLKIFSFHVKDPEFNDLVSRLIDYNFDRVVNNAFLKFLVLQSYRGGETPKQKEVILKKLSWV